MNFPADAPWLINEQLHAGPEHLDSVYVQGYDRKAQTDPTADIARLQQLGLDAKSTVIDFGAGTGVFALAVAPLVNQVIAVDPSPAMIAVLQTTVAERGLTNVRVVEAGFLSYQHRGVPVDCIYTRNALHHLPDFWKTLALARMHNLLAPNGLLFIRDLIYDFQPAQSTAMIDGWLAGAVEDPTVGWTAAELAEHIRTEQSTFRWLFEKMLEATDFTILECVYQRHVYGTYLCRAGTNPSTVTTQETS